MPLVSTIRGINITQIYIGTNGCYNARATTVVTENALRNSGYSVTKKPSKADIIIYATCGVKQDREDSSIEELKKLLEQAKPDTRLIITGCLPEINRRALEETFGEIVEIVSSHELPAYLKILSEYQSANRRPLMINHGSGAYLPEDNIEAKLGIRNRLYIINSALNEYYEATTPGLQLGREKEPPDTIIASRGCYYRCTYCDIWRAIGLYTSKPLEEIMGIIAQSQNRRIVLTADELGLWGSDLKPKRSLSELADALLQTEGHQFYLRNIEPKPLIDNIEAIQILAESGKIFYLSAPMQSASLNILKAMKRPYGPDEAMIVLKALRDIGVIIETHIMVGFPGETTANFRDSFGFIEELSPDGLSIVKYSDRPNAPAKDFSGKIHDEEKTIRQQELLELFKSQLLIKYSTLLPDDIVDKDELIKNIVDTTFV
ncbi:MAG: radical SAM protein [archaeon]